MTLIKFFVLSSKIIIKSCCEQIIITVEFYWKVIDYKIYKASWLALIIIMNSSATKNAAANKKNKAPSPPAKKTKDALKVDKKVVGSKRKAKQDETDINAKSVSSNSSSGSKR